MRELLHSKYSASSRRMGVGVGEVDTMQCRRRIHNANVRKMTANRIRSGNTTVHGNMCRCVRRYANEYNRLECNLRTPKIQLTFCHCCWTSIHSRFCHARNVGAADASQTSTRSKGLIEGQFPGGASKRGQFIRGQIGKVDERLSKMRPFVLLTLHWPSLPTVTKRN